MIIKQTGSTVTAVQTLVMISVTAVSDNIIFCSCMIYIEDTSRLTWIDSKSSSYLNYITIPIDSIYRGGSTSQCLVVRN